MEKNPRSSYIVRFNDCDPFGHLNNSRYFDYLINAREDHLREHYDLTVDSFTKQGFGWVVSGHEILYLKPAKYNETVSVRSQLLNVEDSNLLVEITMTDAEETHLKAILWTKFVFINLKTGKKDVHPEEFKNFLLSLKTDAYPAASTIRERIAAFQPAGLKPAP